MNEATKVSVIIPCFNHGEFLPEAVRSVTDVRRDVEMIVVDDGSTDERTLCEIGKLLDQGICVLRQENRGPSAARNAGIRIANGKYILPLDADNRVHAGYFEAGVRTLDDNPRVGVVYGDAQYMGSSTERWNVGAFEPHRLLWWNFIDTCALYRKCIWEQNAGYDETELVQGLEDWDFWLGALENGWQFAYIPEVLFDYRLSERSMRTRILPFKEEVEEFIAKKHGLLYRQNWQAKMEALQALAAEHRNKEESVKWTIRNLGRLATLRLKRKLSSGAQRRETALASSRILPTP